MIVDLKMWLRQPKLVIMALAPLLILSVFAGLFLAKTEILPVAIVLEDDDPAAIRLESYLMGLESGAGATWFSAEEDDYSDAMEKFDSGEVLGLITIPANLSSLLDTEEVVEINITINNINNDVTKNFLQRMENAFNYFNEDLEVEEMVYYIPQVNFIGNTSPDLPLVDYICTSILGLAILLSASLAITFSIAREFEDGTMKELVMTPKVRNILAGKFLSAIVQALIVTVFILLEEWVIFGYLPVNLPTQILYFIWGALFSMGIGAIVAAKIKQILPAGILVMVLNIAGWWISGGLAPSEAWTGLLRTIADYWPGTYFYQTYINAALLGSVGSSLLLRNLLITGGVAIVLYGICHLVFVKEARKA